MAASLWTRIFAGNHALRRGHSELVRNSRLGTLLGRAVRCLARKHFSECRSDDAEGGNRGLRFPQ